MQPTVQAAALGQEFGRKMEVHVEGKKYIIELWSIRAPQGQKTPRKESSFGSVLTRGSIEYHSLQTFVGFENAFPIDESQEQEARMPVIKVKDNESFEQAMKRFKKTCEKAGILTELRRREYYDKPSISKKKKAAAARKRALKKIRRMTH